MALCLIVFATGCEFGKKEEATNNTNSNTTVEQNQNTVASAGYRVSFGGFTFNLPEGMEYEISEDELAIADENATWVAMIGIIDGSFNQIKNNVGEVQALLQQQGMQVDKPAEIKTLGGKEYVTVDMSSAGNNIIGAYAGLNEAKAAWIIIYNSNNSFDYTALSALASVLSSASYSPMANSIAQNNFNIDLDAISALAK